MPEPINSKLLGTLPAIVSQLVPRVTISSIIPALHALSTSSVVAKVAKEASDGLGSQA